MASNSFGELFRITTWGESHGKAIGVVIDGCPAGLPLSQDEIAAELKRRSPGQTPFTSPRKEEDKPEILSGIFEGKTTGTPISILIWNRDVDSRPYEPLNKSYKPGHAQFAYLEKYGVFDHRGWGRASARETACRVAAGAVAKKLLSYSGIEIVAYLESVGDLPSQEPVLPLRGARDASPIFCPNPDQEAAICQLLTQKKEEGDSVGGVVAYQVIGVPAGLGDPVYRKLEAQLAYAMMSLPATKGWEIGAGFRATTMDGSAHNDQMVGNDGKVEFQSNNAGGTLGGISTGTPIVGRVAFKPASSIRKEQVTATLDGQTTTIAMPKTARHDPCVAIRAVPVVEAMTALVLADALLFHRCSKL